MGRKESNQTKQTKTNVGGNFLFNTTGNIDVCL